MTGNNSIPNSASSSGSHLKKLANYKMPFGKYKGNYLVNIPEPYYVWFKQKGFPTGTLGSLLHEMYEIKVNGLEHLIRPLIDKRTQE